VTSLGASHPGEAGWKICSGKRSGFLECCRTAISRWMLLTREEEARWYDGRRRWRTRGWVTEERRLVEVVDRRVFKGPASWLALLPERAEPFTSRDLAEAIGVRVELAHKMTYSLREAGFVQPVGKRGRATLYGADATDSRRRCGHTAGAFEADSVGAAGAEATAPRAAGRAQSVVKQFRGLGRDRTMADDDRAGEPSVNL
jgi:hypothetical protein